MKANDRVERLEAEVYRSDSVRVLVRPFDDDDMIETLDGELVTRAEFFRRYPSGCQRRGDRVLVALRWAEDEEGD